MQSSNRDFLKARWVRGSDASGAVVGRKVTRAWDAPISMRFALIVGAQKQQHGWFSFSAFCSSNGLSCFALNFLWREFFLGIWMPIQITGWASWSRFVLLCMGWMNWCSKREGLSVLLHLSCPFPVTLWKWISTPCKNAFYVVYFVQTLWLYDGENINCHLGLSAAASLNVTKQLPPA